MGSGVLLLDDKGAHVVASLLVVFGVRAVAVRELPEREAGGQYKAQGSIHVYLTTPCPSELRPHPIHLKTTTITKIK